MNKYKYAIMYKGEIFARSKTYEEILKYFNDLCYYLDAKNIINKGLNGTSKDVEIIEL